MTRSELDAALARIIAAALVRDLEREGQDESAATGDRIEPVMTDFRDLASRVGAN